METEIFTNIHNKKQMMQIEIPFLYNTIDTNKDTTLNTNDKIIQLKIEIQLRIKYKLEASSEVREAEGG